MPARTHSNRFPIIAREGWPIVAAFVLIGSGASAAALWWLGPSGYAVVVVAALLCIWCVWFFRDPERATPQGPGLVISPADGVICFVGQGVPPKELGLPPAATNGMHKISVFMNVFDVHVNRSPCAGVVKKVAYHAGKFINASFDKASEDNERCSIVLAAAEGREIVFVQIAGLVARRIICRVKEGDMLARAERYGLIRFGSRVDIYLPADAAPRVKVGERMVAGETVIGTMKPAGETA